MADSWSVILFYKYVPIASPDELGAEQRSFCSSLGLKGRILIADEGINGTLAGPTAAIERYIGALKVDARFADIEFKWSAGDSGTFPKLVVKVRREIVTLNAGAIAPDQHNHLSAAEWKRAIEQDPEIVLL